MRREAPGAVIKACLQGGTSPCHWCCAALVALLADLQGRPHLQMAAYGCSLECVALCFFCIQTWSIWQLHGGGMRREKQKGYPSCCIAQFNGNKCFTDLPSVYAEGQPAAGLRLSMHGPRCVCFLLRPLLNGLCCETPLCTGRVRSHSCCRPHRGHVYI